MNKFKDNKFVIAWQKAANDLNLDIQFPNAIKNTDVTIYIKDYGSPNGMIITRIGCEINPSEIEDKELFHSFLSDTYEVYDRELFVDTLNDWGYYGEPSQKPDWYNGKHW
uniref:hypothetical protein n=1 Tax=Gelidibacter sp. TaxID=2018083 RepID=UPI00404AD330